MAPWHVGHVLGCWCRCCCWGRLELGQIGCSWDCVVRAAEWPTCAARVSWLCANCPPTPTFLTLCRYDGLYVIIRAGMEPSQSGPLVCRWGAASAPAAERRPGLSVPSWAAGLPSWQVACFGSAWAFLKLLDPSQLCFLLNSRSRRFLLVGLPGHYKANKSVSWVSLTAPLLPGSVKLRV